MTGNLVHRFRRWVVAAIAFGALLYLAGSIAAGLDETRDALARFDWRLAVPVVLLTLANYGLRFAKWHYLVRRLGIAMPLAEDAWNFAAGLAMVISPGKAGELLKPYVVRERTGAPMARTVPALFAERLTDGVAMLLLAGLGVTTYAADKAHYVTVPAAVVAAGLAVLSSRRLTHGAIALAARLPRLGGLARKLEEMVESARTCLAPAPLLLTTAVSVVAWLAECVGYLLVLRGLGIDASLDVAVFIYAFATVAGGAMPGGLGVADGALAALALALVPGVGQGDAVAAALLVRVATLWLGVGLGALALFRVSALLGGIELPRRSGEEAAR